MSEKSSASPLPTGPTPLDFFNWVSQFAQPMIEAGAKLAAQVPMPPGGDPVSVWKNMSQQNEQAWTQFMAQLVNTPEFAASLGRTASSQAAMRDATRKAAQTYLEAANMPTRDDITRLAAQIVALDAKLDGLDERISEAGLEGLTARLDRLDQQTVLNQRISEMENRQLQFEEISRRLTALEERGMRNEARGSEPGKVEAGENSPEGEPVPVVRNSRSGRRATLRAETSNEARSEGEQ